MTDHNQEALIVKLAQMFMRKDSKSNDLKTSLSLVCKEFRFDGALFYEGGQYNHRLCLTESYGTHSGQTELALDSLLPGLYTHLVKETMINWNHEANQSLEQEQLLSLLEAKSVVAVSSADENDRIYALVILCNRSKKEPMDEITSENLWTALSMIINYASVKIYRDRIRFSQTALENILDNTGIDIYVNDFYNHDILYVNESMAMPYGGKAEFTGRKCWQVLFPGQTASCEFCPQKQLIDEEGKPTRVYTWDYERVFDGSWFRVFSAAFRWADGRLAHVVSSADITENKHNEKLIRYMANYDSLTNLPNRRMLVENCEQQINQASEKESYLLFFDIDGFKDINDTLGHDAGDEFLVKLGEFFMGIPMLKNSIYRNGGDEFVALLEGDGLSDGNIKNLSYFIHTRFKKPWDLKKGTVNCGISIGVARYPKDGRTAEELLQRADQAMYRVKKEGGNGLSFASKPT